MSVDSDPVCARMVPLAPIPSVASPVYASMAGLDLTAVSISMTALVLPASMAPRASTGWAASTAGAPPEKQVSLGRDVLIVKVAPLGVL